MIKILLWIFLIFTSVWGGFFGYYIFLEIIFDKKYINYTLLLEESFKDVIYPCLVIVLVKVLFSKKLK